MGGFSMFKQTGGARIDDHALAAMQLMRDNGIAPTPANYQVFFTYAAGIHKQLKQTIDLLVSNKRAFSDAVCHDLSYQFFQSNDAAAQTTSVTVLIEQLLASLKSNTLEAGLDISQFSAQLNEASVKLEQHPHAAGGLTPVINGLIDATLQMESRNRSLEIKLRDSGEQMDELQKKLETISLESLTDPLTEIGNRRAFDIQLRRYVAQGMETGGMLCLLLLDIDNFKQFNDTYGHSMGDQVLRLVASLITKTLAGRGFGARYGGEEFTIILPNSDLTQAVDIANAIRETLSNRNIVKRASGEVISGVTVSIGASLFKHGEPLATLIERTDAALYAAKHTGRNRVVCQDELQRLGAPCPKAIPIRKSA